MNVIQSGVIQGDTKCTHTCSCVIPERKLWILLLSSIFFTIALFYLFSIFLHGKMPYTVCKLQLGFPSYIILKDDSGACICLNVVQNYPGVPDGVYTLQVIRDVYFKQFVARQ